MLWISYIVVYSGYTPFNSYF